MNRRALVVEDEIKIAQLLCDYLVNEGFNTVILNDGTKVIPHVKSEYPDIILLDIMLPGLDGIEVCKQLRQFCNVPIIMITARVDEVDKLLGLGFGADDYICKPFSPREVMARVKTVLRRCDPQKKGKHISAGPIIIEKLTRKVEINGMELSLTPNEFDLLSQLAIHPDRVFSRSELISSVQGYTYEGYERAVDSHIKNLRKKIATVLPKQDLIQTVYGVGYRLVPGESSP